jgi:hypothetical protein
MDDLKPGEIHFFSDFWKHPHELVGGRVVADVRTSHDDVIYDFLSRRFGALVHSGGHCTAVWKRDDGSTEERRLPAA